MKHMTKALVAISLCICASVSALAQDSYPSRPIKWLVGGAAGGPTDAVARMVAEQVSKELGQSIIIENVGGAGGTIATTKVARAAPDGYTLLVGHVGYVAAAPSLYKKLAYDPAADLDAVFRFPDIPGVVLVNANSKFRTLADLIAYAKQNPGKLNFGDAGVGSMSNLVAAMLASQAGIKITAVSYKGNGPAMLDVMTGQIDALIDTANTALPQIRGGKVIALATTGLQPMSLFPGVRPVADNLPGFEGTVWFGIYGPKGLPKPVIDKLHKAYLEAMGDSAFTQKVVAQGMQLLPEAQYGPDAFEQFTKAEIKKYQTVVREAHIQPQ